MNSDPVISTCALRKEYDDVVSLKSLDLKIGPGEAYGLIGPNGAGKSTLLKILATALKPDFGTARVCGFDVCASPLEVRRRVGFMPDFFSLYESMTATDFLAYFGLAFGMDRESVPGAVNAALETVNLIVKKNSMINELSRGMRQRLVLAKTMLHDPEVLLLDEPLSGLDPLARSEMRELLFSARQKGKTIIISSHILSDLKDLCTSMGVLEKGVLRASGKIDELLAGIGGVRTAVFETLGDAAKAARIVEALDFAEVSRVDGSSLTILARGGRERIADVNAALVAGGIGVLTISEKSGDLEDVFFNVSSHEVN